MINLDLPEGLILILLVCVHFFFFFAFLFFCVCVCVGSIQQVRVFMRGEGRVSLCVSFFPMLFTLRAMLIPNQNIFTWWHKEREAERGNIFAVDWKLFILLLFSSVFSLSKRPIFNLITVWVFLVLLLLTHCVCMRETEGEKEMLDHFPIELCCFNERGRERNNN